MLTSPSKPDPKTQPWMKARPVARELKSVHHGIAWLGLAPMRPQEFWPSSKRESAGSTGDSPFPWKGKARELTWESMWKHGQAVQKGRRELQLLEKVGDGSSNCH